MDRKKMEKKTDVEMDRKNIDRETGAWWALT